MAGNVIKICTLLHFYRELINVCDRRQGKVQSREHQSFTGLEGSPGSVVPTLLEFADKLQRKYHTDTHTHTHTHKGTNIGLPTFILQNETVKIITISYHNHSIKEMIF